MVPENSPYKQCKINLIFQPSFVSTLASFIYPSFVTLLLPMTDGKEFSEAIMSFICSKVQGRRKQGCKYALQHEWHSQGGGKSHSYKGWQGECVKFVKTAIVGSCIASLNRVSHLQYYYV